MCGTSSSPSSDWIRSQFPALKRQVNGKHAIYFDGPGGSQVPQTVANAMNDHILHHNANYGGCFATGKETVAMADSVRAKIAQFLNCQACEVTFGQNMTSLTFAFSRAIAQTWKPGDNIIVSQMDHDANITTWQRAATDRGVEVRILPFDIDSATIQAEHLRDCIDSDTQLVALTSSSNLLGSHVDIIAMRKIAHEHQAKIYVDAVHHAPHYRINVQELGCDFLVCSAYKFFGPHIGILYGKEEWMSSLTPYKIDPSPSTIPHCWETGTQNFTAMAGLGATLDYLLQLGGENNTDFDLSYSAIANIEQPLTEHFLQRKKSIPSLNLHGCRGAEHRAPTFALSSEEYAPEELSQHLADHGIFTWHGHLYAVRLIDALELPSSEGVLRAGLMHYNTHSEIDCMFDLLESMRP